MTTPKQILNSHSPSPASPSGRDRGPYSAHYAVKRDYSGWILLLIILVILGGVALVFAQRAPAQTPEASPRYNVTSLPSLGSVNDGGNSINDRTWVGGYSTLSDGSARHASIWRDNQLTDLGTLGGPNSSVAWSVKTTRDLMAGISQTRTVQPLGEIWSAPVFFSGPFATKYLIHGFVWRPEHGLIPLSTLGHNNNAIAAGLNNRGLIVGWAENDCHDPNCVPPQVLQFKPVFWDTDNANKIHELPLGFGDTSGAAIAINDRNQIVGISGICDQAIGRRTAKHAVLWQDDKIINLGNLGARWWNTPTNINRRGDIVGFAGDPAYPNGEILHAFIWTPEAGIRPLGALPNRTPKHVASQAYGINERRQVVGISCDADGVDCRGFLWENGVMKDLNDLKQSDYTGLLERAKDINDRGEITGRAIVNLTTGQRAAFLAKPVHCN